MSRPITTPITPDGPIAVRGVLATEHHGGHLVPHRLPPARCLRGGLLPVVAAQATGVRLEFRTEATTVALETMQTRMALAGLPDPSPGPVDLCVGGRPIARAGVSGGAVVTCDLARDAVTRHVPGGPGVAVFTGLPAGDKHLTLWLPHLEAARLIALRTDAPVRPPEPRRQRVWLHHGSSISHGVGADGPTGTWPAVAAARAGVGLINLGLAGNALLDVATARAIADARADLLSVKLGVNLVTADHLRRRDLVPALHRFLDTIRSGHPTTPLLVISPIAAPLLEHTPGPVALADEPSPQFRIAGSGGPGGRELTLGEVRDAVTSVAAERAARDPNLHFLDGRALFSEQDVAELPFPDDLHPGTAGYRRMGERFARLVFAQGPFDARRGKHS